MERLTPLDIFNKDFKYAFRGYDVDEVNEFLDLVIKNFERLIEENRQLKEQLASLEPVSYRKQHEPKTEELSQRELIESMLRRIEQLEAKTRG